MLQSLTLDCVVAFRVSGFTMRVLEPYAGKNPKPKVPKLSALKP